MILYKNVDIKFTLRLPEELHKEIDTLKGKMIAAQFELQNKCQQCDDALQEYYNNTKKDFDIFNESIQYQKQEISKELQKMDQTYQSRIAARIREEEVKQKKDFYCLHLSQDELQDISVLNTIKPKLKNPRILSMLIWSTYYQKKMTTLCNNITGVNPITGIYKITNLTNSKIYVSQSIDIFCRWRAHLSNAKDPKRQHNSLIDKSVVLLFLTNSLVYL